MRILVHEYAGHPFQLQLSRALAARGHDVLHAYCGSTHTPRGELVKRGDDAPGFDVLALDLGEMIPKDGYWKRFKLERAYGALAVDAVEQFRPDVVVSANTPSIPQVQLVKHCRRQNVRHVFWVQDVYGIAAYKLLKRKVPVVGHAVGQYFIQMDKTTARLSDAIVLITEDFTSLYEQWGVDRDRMHVVHNWSDLGAIEVRPRDNAWSQQHGLKEGPRFIYTGTMAMKHNPALLLELAKLCDQRGAGEVIVVSEGIGAEWLERAKAEQGVRSLRTMGFIPFEQMADCLGSADALVAILEPDAGVFSVPSKVLSYLCSGRAILAAMPSENLAARILADHGAGVVSPPDDLAGFRRLAEQLLDAPEKLPAMGAAARQYAEEHFDIAAITDRFEKILGG
ncbi:MAG: glycosyltransferase family 4 protein [Planctomycetales bacterium]|nr:glycosyltransferase family 4 protein [Planctomycetales bacterium]